MLGLTAFSNPPTEIFPFIFQLIVSLTIFYPEFAHGIRGHGKIIGDVHMASLGEKCEFRGQDA